MDGRAGRAPAVDAGEQEQPYHADEMPVPRGGFEAEMLRRREVAEECAHQADGEEARSDDHVEAMEAGGHEKRRAVDAASEGKRCVRVFIGLNASEQRAEHN